MSEKIIELIFGKRGSGKSYLANYMVRDAGRLIIYDTLGEYKEGVIVEDVQTLSGLLLKVYRKNFRIIYQPLDPDGEFDQVCELVWAAGNLVFLVEEVDVYARPMSMSLPFKSVVQRGRHRDITLIGVTQRPHGVSRLLTSQAKAMHIFNTTEPRDLAYFSDVVGQDVIAKFEQLKGWEFVTWLDGNKEPEIRQVA